MYRPFTQYVALLIAGLALQSTDVQSAGAIPWDSNCGVTKGCFPACQSRCSYLVTWVDNGDNTVSFTVQAEVDGTNQWVALAFSDDYRMGDDSVVACLSPGNTVESSYNKGTENELLSPTSTGLSATSVSVADDVMTCSFTRTTTNADTNFYDISSKSWILQLGIGEVEQEDGGYEMGHHEMIPYSSDGKVDFQSNTIVAEYKMNSPLVKLHGIMMVLGWLLLSTVGLLTARYNKEMLVPRTLLGTKIWFQLHRAAMIAVLVFVIIGFIPIFVEVEGYSQLTPPSNLGFVSSHPVLGIISLVCLVANPIMALLRPGPDHKLRWLFNWSHLSVGFSGHGFAVLTIFFGYYLERSVLPRSTVYVTVIYILAIAFVVLLLELHKHKLFLDGKSKVSASDADVNMDTPKGKSSSDTAAIPFFALVLMSLVLFAISITLLGLIAAS